MSATLVPPLQQKCLHVLASSLVGHATWQQRLGGLQAGVAALPQELRLEVRTPMRWRGRSTQQ